MGILEGLLREGLGGRCRVCVLAGDINVLHRVSALRFGWSGLQEPGLTHNSARSSMPAS